MNKPLLHENVSPFAIVIAAGLFYFLLFAIMYPTSFSIVDEGYYINMGYGFTQGTLQVERYSLSAGDTVKVFTSDYAPLSSLIYSWIILFFSWRSVFVLSGVLFLCSVFLFLKIMRHYSLSPAFSLLLLLHPVAFFYSRTIMSDQLSMFLILLFFFLYVKAGQGFVDTAGGNDRNRSKKKNAGNNQTEKLSEKSELSGTGGAAAGLDASGSSAKSPVLYFFAGVVLGLSLSARQTNAVVAFPFFLFFFVDLVKTAVGEYKQSKKIKIKENKNPLLGFVLFLSGFLFMVLVIPLYQWIIWRDPFFVRHSMGFSFSFFLNNLPFYFLWLNILFPLMFLSVFFFRRAFYLEIIGASLLLFFLYSVYEYTGQWSGFPKNVFLSLRFFLPVLPFLLLAYAEVLSQLYEKLLKKTALFRKVRIDFLIGAAALVLFLPAGYISLLHKEETNTLAKWQAEVQKQIEGMSDYEKYIMVGKNTDKFRFEFLFDDTELVQEMSMPPDGTIRLPETGTALFLLLERADRTVYTGEDETYMHRIAAAAGNGPVEVYRDEKDGEVFSIHRIALD